MRLAQVAKHNPWQKKKTDTTILICRRESAGPPCPAEDDPVEESWLATEGVAACERHGHRMVRMK
jgi:hypothetical protein